MAPAVWFCKPKKPAFLNRRFYTIFTAPPTASLKFRWPAGYPHYKTKYYERAVKNTFKPYNKENPSIYLDLAVIMPREDLKRHFEFFESKKLNTKMAAIIAEELSFPKLPSDPIEIENDSLVVDVAVSGYQVGSFLEFTLGNYFVPLIWRPRIKLRSRLYKFQNKQTTAEYLISKAMPWGIFIKSFLSPSIIYTNKDHNIKHLLSQALFELKSKIKQTVL